ncbi:MAG: hypothetical protein M3O35_20275 [Acidobacteriota bacterium]|nr:hypothetical protein [Acidobacteriota bacterium]
MIQRALRAAGKFSSGAKDTSSDHDLYVAEAIQASRSRLSSGTIEV